MIWIILIVALGLFLVPIRFRKVAYALAGALCLIFLTIVLIDRRPAPDPLANSVAPTNQAPLPSRRFDFDAYERDKRDRADPESKLRIPTTEVRFDQVGSVPGFDSGGNPVIRARLYNDSARFTLTDYAYYLRIQDCLADVPCTTVYDQRAWQSQTVPPGQARDVVIAILKNSTGAAAPFKLLGKARIDLTPEQTRAYSASASTQSPP